MATKVSFEVHDGSNAFGTQEHKPFDMFCPLMTMKSNPNGLNYWKENCLYRQTLPQHRKTCTGGCKIKTMAQRKKASYQVLTVEESLELGKIWYELVCEGARFKALAIDFGYSNTTISKYVARYTRENNLPHYSEKVPRNLRFADIWIKIKEEEGISNQEIADRFNVSVSTVTKYVTQSLEGQELCQKN